MTQLLPEEIEAREYHRLVVNFGEEFLSEKGLCEEFLRFAKERQKKEEDDYGFLPV